jgi:serine/threonine protein kinase
MLPAEFGGTARYRILRRIGEGGMGVVYEAEDTEQKRRVALKTLKAGDANLLYRLKREFRALADLEHPNLISLYELVADGEQAFFTMELVDGMDVLRYVHARPVDPEEGVETKTGATAVVAVVQDTAQRPRRRARSTAPPATRPLACDEVRLRAVLPQLVAGLDALHRTGKLHRDVKPSNAVVTHDGRLVLIDLGVVGDRGLGDENIEETHVVGTAAYMAPEQAAGSGPLTPAADWYSVGVILYVALTGSLPFGGTVARVLGDKQRFPPPPPRAIVPTVPPDLDALCVQLLAIQPEQRPQTTEILARLGAAPLDGSATPTTSTTGPRAPELVGRDRELEALTGAMVSGKAGAMIVSGPSGIGKSTLLKAFVSRVKERLPRAVALTGRCYERETVPYRAMDPLIDHLSRVWEQLPATEAALLAPRDAALVGQLFPVLRRVWVVAQAPPSRRAADPQRGRTLAYAALRELLARFAERVPLVLVLDDLQWVDADTLVLLADVMRPPDPPPLLLVLSTRPEGAAALEGMLEQLDLPHQRVDLDRLDPEDAERLARALLSSQGGALAPLVAREAEGDPFLTEELARHLALHGGAQGVSIEDALASRLTDLPDAARTVLELVAVAGEPTSRTAAARAAGLDEAALDEATRLLSVRHLLLSGGRRPTDSLETYHDRIRAAVLANLAPAALAAHHRALATALSSEAVDERLARHWHGAGELDRAATFARKAAADALARLEFDRAARLYRMAIDLGRYEPAELRALRVAEGESLAQAGRPGDAADAFQAAALGAPPAEEIELRRRAAEQLLRGGYVDRGLEAIEHVLAAIDAKLPSSPSGALFALLRRRAWLRLRGLGWRARDAGSIPPTKLTQVDTFGSISAGLGMVDPLRGADAHARELLLALQLGEPARVARALAYEVGYLAAFGHGARAAKLAQIAEDCARKAGDAESLVVARWSAAVTSYFCTNRWRSSLRGCSETEETSAAAGHATDTAQLFSCLNLMYLGELGELGRKVAGYVAEAKRRGDRYLEVCIRSRLNVIWLAADDPARAEREAREAIEAWIPASRAFQVQHYYALFSRCEAAIYRGDAAAAADDLDGARAGMRAAHLFRVPMVAVEAVHLEGRIALARGAADPAVRRGAIGRALRAAGRLRAQPPVARGLGLLLRAGAAAAAGDRDRAAAQLRAAIAALEDLETMLFAQAARARLGETIGGEPGQKMIAEAHAWMQKQGVKRPDRMTATLVPGWPSAPALPAGTS